MAKQPKHPVPLQAVPSVTSPEAPEASTPPAEEQSSRVRKINRDMLAKIKLARQEALSHANQAATHQIKAQSAENAMRLIVAEALIQLSLPVTGNVVCLSCGTVRAETQPLQPCPSCGAA